MFSLTDQPIDSENLRRSMRSASAGAVVTFEGDVRELNEGRHVVHLDYEGAPELAASEFERILEEVRRQFEVVHVRCVHRTGRLQVGETAVWIGVAAAHRDAAFAACRYVIDELKQRLPIWKKETYTDGESDWLNKP